ncbi:glycosyltransferase family 4 protein [Vibrio aestuarianus]|uniref:glycosyltransferase family 4 protein n=1 Tax=Vibrio aestuarianus TaxID=28171 RepID=UPI00237CB6FC|nr:glycosyltransferase family 4 protein [Vibrio aestuarianus]MDE1339575.1 glycosyltransferase family 4 protein [Vibrio aestuarianus]
MKQKINLTVATDLNGQGGIATVLNVYKESGFFANNNVKLISTHSTKNRFGKIGAFALFLLATIKLISYFIFYDIGLVHIHMASRGSYQRKSLLIRIAKAFKAKVILHLHGAEFRDFYANECDERKQAHIRHTFEICDVVIVLSTHWLAWANETLSKSDHVKVLYNAVPSLRLQRSNAQLGVIAFLGRVGPRKGALDLLHAFKIVKEVCPHALLKMAGDGNIAEYKQEAKTLGIDDSVEFLGWISGPRKMELLEITDVYCLPSYNEGFPMGILEAMSAEIAVVSSYAGGIPDAITNNIDGLLVEAGDIYNLSQALISLINNRDINRQFVISAKSKFEDRFSIKAIIPQLQNIYKEVLDTE